MKQRIAFLYLATGGGHKSAAKALSSALSDSFPSEIECFQKDVCEKGVPFLRFFFEAGYSLSSNYFELSWVLSYQFTNTQWGFSLLQRFLKPFIIPPIKEFLIKNKISKVVCLHGLLTRAIRCAINRINPAIELITIVLDPFSSHYYWFSEKNTDLIVFSKKVYNDALQRYHFKPEQVVQYPLILSKAFDRVYTEEEKNAVKQRLGFASDEKILLIAGGGEGLKTAPALVREFIRKKLAYRLIIVCGKNKILHRQLTRIVAKSEFRQIRLYGFVDFMPDLMNIADCVISKSGPATVMETLKSETPLILSSYIRGQELGNMLYVVQNKVGWFLPNAKDAIAKADEILADVALQSKIKGDIAGLNIQNGLTDISWFIFKE